MMRLIVQACAGLALAGCVVAPPVAYVQPPLQQTPFVAVPGPGKNELAFRQDDSFCRTTPQPVARPISVQPGAPPGQEAVEPTPGVLYLQCMEARNNLVQPMQQAAPQPVYAYLQPYPVYVGPWYGYGYPWYYGSLGFGGFGGFYGYRGYGGFGHGYAYRSGFGYGGYREGGGGYRGGAGWGGGGWGGGPGGFRGGFRR